MLRRVQHRILATLLVGLTTIPAFAQYTRDASATKKIDEAINTHYLMAEIDKAENLLTGVVQACEDKCRPATKAKAWMYVGLIRGSAKMDQAGAAEAFKMAKSFDPAIKLDEPLASADTKKTWQSTTGEAAAAPVAAAPVAAAVPAEMIPGDMICTPEVRDIATRMPLPISCSSDDPTATTAIIKFQEFGSDQWKKMTMTKSGDYFQATIPCDVTGTAGPFKFYVGAKDEAGEYIDQYGSKKEPATINLSDNATGPAPAFPGGQPVVRCADKSDCPPDFPGCESSTGATATCGDKDWGASCKNSAECACGLLCDGGQCVNAPSCTTDSECDTGTCVDGTCSVVGGDTKGPAGPFAKHWLGLDVGIDMTTMGGGQLCTPDNAASYGSYCYTASGVRTENDTIGIDGAGLAIGQMRIKLGYDFAFTDKIQLGARVGMAFINTPPSDPTVSNFLPVHGEARFTYNFTSLANTGFRPAIYAGGGVAEVAGATTLAANLEAGRPEAVTIYKRAGVGMGAVGGKFAYAIAPNMEVKLDVNVMFLFGSYPFNVALTPSLGFVYGL